MFIWIIEEGKVHAVIIICCSRMQKADITSHIGMDHSILEWDLVLMAGVCTTNQLWSSVVFVKIAIENNTIHNIFFI